MVFILSTPQQQSYTLSRHREARGIEIPVKKNKFW